MLEIHMARTKTPSSGDFEVIGPAGGSVEGRQLSQWTKKKKTNGQGGFTVRFPVALLIALAFLVALSLLIAFAFLPVFALLIVFSIDYHQI